MLTQITNLEVGPMQEKATTQRTNFPFNSFFELDGTFFGCSSDGLFLLGGDDDDGVDIDAYFVIGSTNLGRNEPKRLGYIYVSLETDGDVYLKATPNMDTDDTLTYSISPTTTEYHVHREKLGRGAKAVNWGFEFGNTDGSNFSVSMLELMPQLLSRRMTRY